ncbi:MAG: acyl-CoA dehydrogenase family protein [Planctomycetaceae bacterium]
MTTTSAASTAVTTETSAGCFASAPIAEGGAAGLFAGKFSTDAWLPYPKLSRDEQSRLTVLRQDVQRALKEQLDPVAVERAGSLSAELRTALAQSGLLGGMISREYGGGGLSLSAYCELLQDLAGRCRSTLSFVHAHHTLVAVAIERFGTAAQKQQWLPKLARGETVGAFALTEPLAGSDAAGIKTLASATADGRGFQLTGEKCHVTNGGFAGLLLVLARTPSASADVGRVSAFLVAADQPGVKITPNEGPQLGIRGNPTAQVSLTNVAVTRDQVLGPIGKGLMVALSTLDIGRVATAAGCTGAARAALEQATRRVKERRQFGLPLSQFEMVQQKIATAAGQVTALEAATQQTAALIDRQAESFLLEASMLKVFASETLWSVANEMLQLHGGAGYYADLDCERLVRDARLALIDAGANEVLRDDITEEGLRHLPRRVVGLSAFGKTLPAVPVGSPRLQPIAAALARQIQELGRASRSETTRPTDGSPPPQLEHARLGDIATGLYVSSCVYARLLDLLEHPLPDQNQTARQLQSGLLFLRQAVRRGEQLLAQVPANEDDEVRRTAALWL